MVTKELIKEVTYLLQNHPYKQVDSILNKLQKQLSVNNSGPCTLPDLID